MTDETTMRYDRHERTDRDHKAETVGLWPGIAGIYLEKHADVYCPKCARDMLETDVYDTVKQENTRTGEYGNVAAVLSDEETDCPGDYCGHCGIQLDVQVLHYDDVCRPDWCDRIDETDDETA